MKSLEWKLSWQDYEGSLIGYVSMSPKDVALEWAQNFIVPEGQRDPDGIYVITVTSPTGDVFEVEIHSSNLLWTDDEVFEEYEPETEEG